MRAAGTAPTEPEAARRRGNLRGALLMCAGALAFAMEALFVRWMNARGIPTATQVLARATGQLVWVVPALIAAGPAVFRTRRPLLHLFRGISSMCTWGLYYISMGLLDLATATVLSFTNVLFSTSLAGPLLGEKVGAARWAGVVAGLVGVAVMLRPWEGAESGIPPLGAAVALLGALTWCSISLSSRTLTRTEPTVTIVAWVGLVTTLGSLPFAIWSWEPLALGDWGVLLAFTVLTPSLLWLLTESYRYGEASAVAPFQYLRLPVLALAGWWLFGEVPDAWGWAGSAVILCSALLVTVAELRRRG
ncbi:DMT family transporter [Roseomonas sp. BN140053]|uniref:DMT family transporter n=1 Tax=Roseomonas sp. BN140053 TaxID=3391898 RepID=UPI0039EB53D8